MKEAIKNLINIAEQTDNFDTQQAILEQIEGILSTLSYTINAPSNWRNIAEELAEEYKDNHDIYEALHLWEYDD